MSLVGPEESVDNDELSWQESYALRLNELSLKKYVVLTFKLVCLHYVNFLRLEKSWTAWKGEMKTTWKLILLDMLQSKCSRITI